MGTVSCFSIEVRKAADKMRGKETKPAAINFIRRTCQCEDCKRWRERKTNGQKTSRT